MKAKKREPRLFEYRIRYNAGAGHSAVDSYHYYSALNAEQALGFHVSMMKKKELSGQTISIEEKNPYSQKWEDKSEIIENYKISFKSLEN